MKNLIARVAAAPRAAVIRCVMLLAFVMFSLSPHAGTDPMMNQLNWMVGPWTGDLGPQTVEEEWSAPFHGSMETMIRLTTDEGVQMLELAVIREVEGSLVLHLRQFSPELELRTDQNMRLEEIGEGFVTFIADEGASIPRLAYKLTAPGQMRVEVTIITGDVVAAELHRPE